MTYLASIWSELENRGVDLSDLRHGIMSYLPMIANNMIDARLVVNYAGQKTLISALSRLPISEQAKIAERGFVTVLKLNNEEKTELQIPVGNLTATEVYQVFSETGIRNASEQLKLLSIQSFRKKEIKKPSVRKARRVKVNVENNVLMIGNSAGDISRVIEQLSEYYQLDLAKLIDSEKLKNQPLVD